MPGRRVQHGDMAVSTGWSSAKADGLAIFHFFLMPDVFRKRFYWSCEKIPDQIVHISCTMGSVRRKLLTVNMSDICTLAQVANLVHGLLLRLLVPPHSPPPPHSVCCWGPPPPPLSPPPSPPLLPVQSWRRSSQTPGGRVKGEGKPNDDHDDDDDDEWKLLWTM